MKFIRFILVGIVIAVLSGFGMDQVNALLNSNSAPGHPIAAAKGKSVKGMKQASDPDGCDLITKPITVTIDKSEYPATAEHIADAWKAGEAKVLHLDREGAEENREESLAGIPTREGHDRDEYPPAVSMEGGEGADIRYVESSDNRGAGSSMGAQLTPYCSGQAFVLDLVP